MQIEAKTMTTEDLRRIDELVFNADMAVRVASQLRLWDKRRSIGDPEAIEEGKRFLEEALSGGRFVATGDATSDSSSLSPLTWSADVRFGFDRPVQPNPTQPQQYQELVAFLDEVRQTLLAISQSSEPKSEEVNAAAKFFSQLGQLLGCKADNALRSPSGGTQLLQERFSYQ
ncbi:hypothetical protein U8335_10700 [Roseiconus lacunae]|uniref:hypothetical protein n=1 Tax=Roseiconus lacunae TaxID=2605694 RepID=UPI00308DD2B5|nr:hypothetical protein U8335_10700 [Stieleria sp. HD01]